MIMQKTRVIVKCETVFRNSEIIKYTITHKIVISLLHISQKLVEHSCECSFFVLKYKK